MFKDKDIICFFGDSITASGYWMAEIYQELRKKYKVKCYNCGVPGAEARQGIQYLHTECLIHNPDYVVLMFGMNDFGLGLYGGFCKEKDIELKKAEKKRIHMENYEAIVKACKEFGSEVIICLPTPYDEVSDVATRCIPYQVALEEGAKFHLEMAEKYGCKVVNLKDALLSELGKRKVINDDRVHPNVEGQHIMAQTFMKELGIIEECDYDTPFEFEQWNKERFDIEFDEIQFLNYVDICVRRREDRTYSDKELIEYIKKDYEKFENKDDFIPATYRKFLEYGERRMAIKGELIKKTIF